MTAKEHYVALSERLATARAQLAQQQTIVLQLEGAVQGVAMVLADEHTAAPPAEKKE